MIKIFKTSNEIPFGFEGKLIVLGSAKNHQLLRNITDFDGVRFTYDNRAGYSYVEYPEGNFR